MNPRHIKEIEQKCIAKAPYNFVELPTDIVEVKAESLPQKNVYYSGFERYTGRIECTLTTKSPLYIRCGLTKPEFECGVESKDLPDFFYTEIASKSRKPVIPGSSLRGMIKSLIEIISFSKIEKVSKNKRLFFRAVAANPSKDSLGRAYKKYVEQKKIQAGYLYKDNQGWYIQPARTLKSNSFAWVKQKDLNLEQFKKFDDDDYYLQYIDISFEGAKIDNEDRAKRFFASNIDSPDVHKVKGVLVTSGNMKQSNKPSPRRNHCIVFEADLNSQRLRLNDTAIEHYCNALTDFQKQAPFDKNYGILEENRPVFYSFSENSNDIGFFGQSPNFRIPYSPEENGNAATVVDFIPPKLRKCSLIDLTDAIFGWVKDDEHLDKDIRQRGGRVFFTDAEYKFSQNGIWYKGNPDDTVTPKILSEPKPTCFQHYLVQPEETKAHKSQLKHYADNPIEDTVIRGHKLYWHKGSNPDIQHPDGDDATGTQITKIKPIKAGVSFKFNIHFENLTHIELGAILWILKIAAEPKYCLSLGMGKPLGMGAVNIEHELFLSNRQNRYSKLFNDNQWLTGEENQDDTKSEHSDCIKAFEKYITKNIHEDDHPEEGKTNKLEEIPRIQMLLLMLRCDNLLSADDTRYMTIEPDNEYKERPVLPTPFQVMGEEDKRRFSTSTISPLKNSSKKPFEKPILKNNKSQKNESKDVTNRNSATARPAKPKKPRKK